MTHTVELSSPVEAHGETLAALTLRSPTGRDIRLCGLPYRFTAEGETQIDATAMAKMVVALAGVPPSTIDRLSAPDWQAAMAAVLGFFNSAPKEARAAPPKPNPAPVASANSLSGS